MLIARKPYPSDVSDDESALVAAYRTLLPEESGQRTQRCARCSTACGIS